MYVTITVILTTQTVFRVTYEEVKSNCYNIQTRIPEGNVLRPFFIFLLFKVDVQKKKKPEDTTLAVFVHYNRVLAVDKT